MNRRRSSTPSRIALAMLLALAVASSPAGAQVRMAEQLAPPAAARPAVTVYVARKIRTVDPANPEATAVAVAGGRIVAVGSLDEVKRALGDRPFTVDETFRSKVILPGLIDQHLHPLLGALCFSTEVIAPEDWVLPDRTFAAATTPEAYRARLRASEAAMKDPGAWLFSWGYHPLWHGKLDRKFLDAVSATRPIFVWHRSVHEFFLNTAAIRALGLDEASMRGKGEASTMYDWDEGHWWETGLDLVSAPLLRVFATPARLESGLRLLVAYLHQNGVTAFMEPGALVTPRLFRLYQEILGADGTPLTSYFVVDGRMQVDRGLGPAESLADTERQIAMAPSGKVSFLPGQIKLFADGAIVSQLMQMKDGYLDGHKGEWLLTPAQIEERTKLYWDAGYQLHVHVNGDLGLEVVLDAIERRMRENPRADHRTVIVHFATSTEEQVGRIARLGAIVSANPYYPVGFADTYAKHGLGPARANVMVRSASVLRHRVPLSFHSDLPMGPAEPLAFMWEAVNRVTPAGHVVGAEERIGAADALRAVTIESAWSWRKEAERGSITPGKVATFTILEEDPLAVAPSRIRDVKVWGTVHDGRVFPVKAPAAGRQAGVLPVESPALPRWSGLVAGHGGDGCGVARLLEQGVGAALGGS
jgi:hypothetical protein